MKIQRFYSSIDQKIDFCQDYLLSDTVTFRAYYAKNASRDVRLVLSGNVTYFWNSRKGDVPYSRFLDNDVFVENVGIKNVSRIIG